MLKILFGDWWLSFMLICNVKIFNRLFYLFLLSYICNLIRYRWGFIIEYFVNYFVDVLYVEEVLFYSFVKVLLF